MVFLALGVCAVIAARSRKPIGKSLALFLSALMPPLFGHILIIGSYTPTVAKVGYYFYFIGMDLVILSLLRFTLEYCSIVWTDRRGRNAVNAVFVLDILQYAFNPFFSQAFDIEPIFVEGHPYYRLVPFFGQTMHRLLDYVCLAAVIIIFIFRSLRTTRVYSEKYWVILASLLVSTVWQTSYIFSRMPVDRSMLAMALTGLLIFYFSLYYRPMKLLDRLLANIASEMPDAMFFFDVNDKCIWANAPGIELTGIDGTSFDDAPVKLAEMFGSSYRRTDAWNSRRILGENDERKYYILDNHFVTDDCNRPAGSFLSVRDVTDEQLSLQREIYSATHDKLTGLYTREYLYKRIAEAIHTNADTEYNVIFVDVKNFKIVNDIFSSKFGDYALQCIAEWISRDLSKKCMYGRLAGDTFGMLVPVEEFDHEQIEEDLTKFVVSDGSVEYHILIHLGVYRIPDRDLEVSVMFDRAHLALSTIKDEYKTHIAYYDDKIRDKVLWDQHITSQLSEAISTMQLRPYLQPIVDSGGGIVGAEALARWVHPTDGFLSPGLFIPVFEKNGMIVEVDKHMWRCSCEILSRWEKTRPELFISVNISPKDFYFMDVVEEISSLTTQYGVAPSRLRIEITETVMMNDSDDRVEILNRFRERGFIVEMDDFGSGYSSLNLLKDMPVDVLKIDMKFLGRSENGTKAQTILRNILNLSSDLGIASLTEGVETPEQYKMLAEMHCKLFQGYYFSKPVPVEDFEKIYLK